MRTVTLLALLLETPAAAVHPLRHGAGSPGNVSRRRPG